jgi:geranylgeranyl diphosphate synthase, type I
MASAPAWDTDTRTASGFLDAVEARLDEELARYEQAWRSDVARLPVTRLSADVDLPALLSAQVTSGGKRLRPHMAYLGRVAAGTPIRQRDWEMLVRLGAALELLHVLGLVQDDVMDASATRRGIPTTHVVVGRSHRRTDSAGSPDRFAESIAVLVGDVSHALAQQLAASLPSDVHALWSSMVLELVTGQALDLVSAADGRRDPESARSVAWLKSGAYSIARPLILGATLGGADAQVLHALRTYGYHLGCVFAVRDDVIGVWGDPEVTGKPVGDDLRQGKNTELLAYAEGRLDEWGTALLDAARSNRLSEDDVCELVCALTDAGVDAAAEETIAEHLSACLEALTTLPRSTPAADDLAEVAERIAWRDH